MPLQSTTSLQTTNKKKVVKKNQSSIKKPIKKGTERSSDYQASDESNKSRHDNRKTILTWLLITLIAGSSWEFGYHSVSKSYQGIVIRDMNKNGTEAHIQYWRNANTETSHKIYRSSEPFDSIKMYLIGSQYQIRFFNGSQMVDKQTMK